MDDHDWLAQRFEEHRTHLRAVAYRMLGSTSEADDAVQEAWLRLNRSDTGEIHSPGGWLTTVVARVCLDMLRSRSSRREELLLDESPGVRLPGPIVSPQAEGFDPEHEALLAVLDPDVVLRADRGAVDAGAPGEVRGAPAVARRAAKGRARAARAALVNGVVGVVVAPRGRLLMVLGFTIRGGKIVEIDILADPDRLRRLDLSYLDD
jgi:RNA polymerase sigma factor (sigma-70 family)